MHRGFASSGVLRLALVAAALGGLPAVASADETDPVAALPAEYLPPPPQKMLPPRDCLQCPGPAPGAPCFDTHRGFLYYGSYPWDDDPANGFDDCPGGRCGRPGAALSLWWIGIHNAKAGARHHASHRGHHHRSPHGQAGCSSCNAVPHYPLGPDYPAGPDHSAGPEHAAEVSYPAVGPIGGARE
ncbi:hypothetical protein [Candidatus Laterigemmans baculatus]|uniref:hypothetical protein n=1 Tax=Candidatus Laterigemmans baculatus TaxID=2770505 RepID=UPI0013DCCA3B|nr:hypothetical protein [Candidatus Laterigemmans baculatus]